ncbi:MAG TPA: AbrB/MazE/SpoVT family DNA-binding domain-containing protein [Chloroflexota bacterium]|nr:AbrB/MazE/SpoVT family DNA-binding domain-containing protein [Chloroflexota bacterium]
MAIAVRVDDKGRLTIPGKMRKELDVKPGDTFFLQREGKVLRYAKATNPFDMLAEQAAHDYHAGETISIDDLAREHGVDLDAE